MPSFFKRLVGMTIAEAEKEGDTRQKVMQDITGFNRPKQKKPKEKKAEQEAPKKKHWGWGRRPEGDEK